VQAPQPVHFDAITKRGCCLMLTVKFPGCPSTRSTSLKVRISMSLCRPISTRRGAMVHIAQSLVGKVLSSCAMTPPMAGPRSAKYTLMPPLARSRAACMPPIPPPTTRAAPTGGVWESSDGMGNNLLCGRLPPGSLPDRQEKQGQRSIDHVRPLAERHLYQQHGRGDDDVQGVHEVTGQRKAGIAENVCRQMPLSTVNTSRTGKTDPPETAFLCRSPSVPAAVLRKCLPCHRG
jgi:hypothetical protein